MRIAMDDVVPSGSPECRRLTTAFQLLCVLVFTGLAAALVHSLHDPDVPVLVNEGTGVWIAADKNFALAAYFENAHQTRFRRRLSLKEPRPAGDIRVRALRECQVWLDGRLLIDSTHRGRLWKRSCTATLPALARGDHELTVLVTNAAGPEALLIDADDIDVATGDEWEALQADGVTWGPVRRAHRPKSSQLSERFPTSLQALIEVWPWILGIFCAGGLLGWKTGTFGNATAVDAPDARRLKWLLMMGWLVLGLRNIRRVPAYVGYDVIGHLEYIQFIAERGRLPLASDGWQMFQSPLYYLLNVPIYLCLQPFFEPEEIVQWLRIIPLLCGVLQVEIAFRIARRVFPEQTGTQCLAVLFAGWLPMSLSMSLGIGNEPLAGCLIALTILLIVNVLTGDVVTRKVVFVIGCVWGLALLTKVSALLLAPALIAAVALKTPVHRNAMRTRAAHLVLLVGTAATVSGWYYLRNWMHFQTPFVGGWNAARGIVWWQDPGFRTWDDLLRFGVALYRPTYAGVHGLWDGLYSTAWADGFLSGVMDESIRPPWNYEFLTVLALLAVIPTLAIAAGLVRTLVLPSTLPETSRPALLFLTTCVLTFLGAVVLLYFRVPIYGSAKASYLLGLQPCFGMLAAVGLQPLTRSRTGAAFLTGFCACWFAAVFFAFFG